MKLGELFYDLGVKGTDKSIGLVKSLRGGLQETTAASLQTKAAILGAAYALKEMFSTSNQVGTDLVNMSTALGISTKTLQQYQYAARQVGVSNQEMDGTFKGLQAAMTKIRLYGDAPKGLAWVAQKVGGMQDKNIDDYMKNPAELIQKLQEYAQKEDNAGIRNEVLSTFGISGGVGAAMRRNAFRPEVLNAAPTYSDSEANSLDKSRAAWSNLGTKVEMAFGHFNAKHGQDIVKNLSLITDQAIKLAEAFVLVAEKFKIFEAFNEVIAGLGKVMQELASVQDRLDGKDAGKHSLIDTILGTETAKPATGNGALTEYSTSLEEYRKQKRAQDAMNAERLKEGKQPLPSIPLPQLNRARLLSPTIEGSKEDSRLDQAKLKTNLRILQRQKEAISPNSLLPPPPPTGPGTQPQKTGTDGVNTGAVYNIEVNQSLAFNGDGTDPAQARDVNKQAVQQVYRQLSAQSQGA